MNDITTHVIEWIQQKCATTAGDMEITASTALLDEELLSSLDFLHLVFFLEETYQVKIDMDALIPENFATPNTIATLVNNTKNS